MPFDNGCPQRDESVALTKKRRAAGSQAATTLKEARGRWSDRPCRRR